MQEEFVCYLWKNKLFLPELHTVQGETIYIMHQGMRNHDAGPDFTDARIRIGSTLWAGNVEVHVNASDWMKHNHHKDKNYDNIILHVVYQNDLQILRSNKEEIPTLEVHGKFKNELYARYLDFLSASRWIPCEHSILDSPSIIRSKTIERMLIERLEKKTHFILNKLRVNQNNWENTFYLQLARSFGFSVNAEAFELLAHSCPLKYLGKHKGNLIQLEAMLFGQAGMLKTSLHDKYHQQLKTEYEHLRNKFAFSPMDPHHWKFLRLRPVNFPTVRIAQFAALLNKSSGLFSALIGINSYQEAFDLFDITPSPYWETHYRFGRSSPAKSKHLGRNSILLIILNTVIPFMFAYGKYKKDEGFTEKALNLYEDIPAEKNAIIRKWSDLGLNVTEASQSQALLELKKSYCDRKRCLDCDIGNYLISGKK